MRTQENVLVPEDGWRVQRDRSEECTDGCCDWFSVHNQEGKKFFTYHSEEEALFEILRSTSVPLEVFVTIDGVEAFRFWAKNEKEYVVSRPGHDEFLCDLPRRYPFNVIENAVVRLSYEIVNHVPWDAPEEEHLNHYWVSGKEYKAVIRRHETPRHRREELV